MHRDRIATRGPRNGTASWLTVSLPILAMFICRISDPRRVFFAFARASLIVLCMATVASAQTAPAQTIWRLLDYIAVDYPEAVENGEIVNQSEYDEMKEFSGTASKLIGELPTSSAKTGLLRQAEALEGAIATKASPQAIAAAARELATDLIKAYPVPLSPSIAPDSGRGKALYAQHCASCHGATGRGDGPQAVGLDPPPIAFTDEKRARNRSVFALYQVIEQGLDGTSMASFADLPSQDRWALAFYAGSLAYPGTEVANGKTLWDSDADLRKRFDLEKLVATMPATLAAELGEDKARQVMAYLRRHPDAAATQPASGTLTLARSRLQEAIAVYERGERKTATDLALSAYLDGFEPAEPILAARDNALMVRIERAMSDLRAAIAKGDPVEAVQSRVATLDGLFAEAETILAPSEASGTSGFIAAFTILAREGLEAILIVIAMMSFLVKAGRRDVLPYLHGGWIVALIVGAGTWAASTWLITISGAGRELTEGVGGVFAAAVLLWVGIWMHGKSHADAWQRYIRDRLGRALSRRSAWLLFALAFIVVYREVFETILFYAAIWSQGNSGAIVSGAFAACVVLALIAFAMLRYSRTLPIGKFFAYSSALLAVLAIVLMGKGSAALQEAGYLPVTPSSGLPRSELLGIYPTYETIGAQLMVALLMLGFLWNRRAAAARGAAA